MTKQLESEVSIMCNLSEDVEQRGFEKGIAKGISREREENIRSLMKTVNWTVEEAMEALQIPEPEREKYANLLKNK